MKHLHWLLLCLLYVQIVTSQSNQTCDKKDQVIVEDLNNINKCKVENKSNKPPTARQIILRLNNSKGRFFRKRRKELVKYMNTISEKGILNKATKTELEGEVEIDNTRGKVFTFQNVDQLPTFSNCKNAEDNLKCFNIGIGTFIQENFEYPEEAIENDVVGKVTVNFVIDREGKVVDIKTKNEENKSDILTQYSKKLISKLSKVTPAMKNGKPVAVSYELSLDFSL